MALLGLVATAFTQAAKPAGSRGVRERQAVCTSAFRAPSCQWAPRSQLRCE